MPRVFLRVPSCPWWLKGFQMATTAVPSSKISGGSFLLESRLPHEIFTPEDFTEQHQLIGQTAEEFARNEIVPNIGKIEHNDFSLTPPFLHKAPTPAPSS